MSDLQNQVPFEPLPFDPIEPPSKRDTRSKNPVTSDERSRIAKVIDLYQDKLERVEVEKEEAYEFAMHILSTFTDGKKVFFLGGRLNAETNFQTALMETGKQTAYEFKTRKVDPKYLVNGGAK